MRVNEVAHLDPEEQYWQNPNPDTMWITDKLILSSKMGYKCGPAGIDVPEAGDYIGFGIDAGDGCCGAGWVTISNFTGPGQIPCIFGCMVFTLPSKSSGKFVNSESLID